MNSKQGPIINVLTIENFDQIGWLQETLINPTKFIELCALPAMTQPVYLILMNWFQSVPLLLLLLHPVIKKANFKFATNGIQERLHLNSFAIIARRFLYVVQTQDAFVSQI